MEISRTIDPADRFPEVGKNVIMHVFGFAFDDPEMAGKAEAAAGIIVKAFAAMLQAKLAADPKQTPITQVAAIKAEEVKWATVEEYQVAMVAVAEAKVVETERLAVEEAAALSVVEKPLEEPLLKG